MALHTITPAEEAEMERERGRESGFVPKDDQVSCRCSLVSTCVAPLQTEASMGGRQGQHKQHLHYGTLCLQKPSQGTRLKDIWYRDAYDTHTPRPPYGVVSCTTRLDFNGMEPGRLQRRILLQFEQ
ncbi:hypothetical protein TNCV_2279911 [Trichonephila clavipes]|uniref:Uncharacterized protein n=1 Tax=Trichonephila clavipes TaxID=2585209 RepID=A0A8X6R502_TRICX|nr:hypothetical protein TNCV_2279911 [Trichonephila clavipes]